MLEEGHRTTAECWQRYPRLPFPENMGARGASQKRARDACVAASMRGQADPELYSGPQILQDYTALWRSKPPYKERPSDQVGAWARAVGRAFDPAGVFGLKTGGDTLRSVAIGWRPPTMTGMARFRELELKGTITGGIEALTAIGAHPWAGLADTIHREVLPLKLRGDTSGGKLVGLVGTAARAAGKPVPTSLDDAAALIRREVNSRQLEGP